MSTICSPVYRQRGLTIRSTGPIAAGRHLGYKSLAQIPAHRNRPVSSNVRPHTSQTVDHHLLRMQCSRSPLFRPSCKVPRELAANACNDEFGSIPLREVKIEMNASLPVNYYLFASNYRFGFCGVGKKVIPVRGWRFAPACCAAQSVIRRGPGCAMPSYRLAWAAQLAAPQQASPIKRFGNENESVPRTSFSRRQANQVVRPNHSLNRTYCGGLAFGL